MDSYTVAELLRKRRYAQRVNPDRIAVTFGSRRLTYDELDERSVAEWLAAHSVELPAGDGGRALVGTAQAG